MHKFASADPKNSEAESLVVVICSQLSNIPYIFRHCDQNKIHEKKQQE